MICNIAVFFFSFLIKDLLLYYTLIPLRWYSSSPSGFLFELSWNMHTLTTHLHYGEEVHLQKAFLEDVKKPNLKTRFQYSLMVGDNISG